MNAKRKILLLALAAFVMAILWGCSRPADPLHEIETQGSAQIKDVGFGLGSLRAYGNALLSGNYQGFMKLTVEGYWQAVCINPAGNIAPGQSRYQTSGDGLMPLQADKKGRSSFNFGADLADPPEGWLEGQCANVQWTAVPYEFYTKAFLSLFDGDPLSGGRVLLTQEYACETRRNPDSVICRFVSEVKY